MRQLSISSEGELESPGTTYADGVLPRCKRCAEVLHDHYYAECPHCSHPEPPGCFCKACNSPLCRTRARVTAKGCGAGTATQVLEGWKCKRCAKIAIEFSTAHLTNAANLAEEPVEVRAEQGVFGARQMEVFSPFDTSSMSHSVSASLNGITVETGPQSDLFASVAYDISGLDNALVDLQDSLRVTPGPPHSGEQRATLEVLLATLRLEVGSELESYDEEDADAFKRLIGQLAVWDADPERACVSLFNAVISGAPPGPLMNTFRLMEVVLDRWWRADVARKRRDDEISDKQFIQLATEFPRKRFDEKLSARIGAMSTAPTDIVERLGALLCGKRSTSVRGVLRAVADFRNAHAHGPISGRSLTLPWEHPNYQACEVALILLIGSMFDDDGLEPALPPTVIIQSEEEDSLVFEA